MEYGIMYLMNYFHLRYLVFPLGVKIGIIIWVSCFQISTFFFCRNLTSKPGPSAVENCYGPPTSVHKASPSTKDGLPSRRQSCTDRAWREIYCSERGFVKSYPMKNKSVHPQTLKYEPSDYTWNGGNYFLYEWIMHQTSPCRKECQRYACPQTVIRAY